MASLFQAAKESARGLLRPLGYELRSIQRPASHLRSIGDVTSLLQDLKARGFPCQSVLDVGASDGSWSRLLKLVFPAAHCCLLEPRSACRDGLEKFCQEYRDSRYVAAGAGPQAGDMTLTDWDTGSTFLAVDPGGAKQVRVPVITLDSLFKSEDGRPVEFPQLVKLDVEGFELEVLRGAETLFGQTELFIIELGLFRFGNPRPLLHEVIAFMAQRGYLTYDIAGFIRRPFDGALGLIDICFARESGFLRDATGAWHRA